MAIFTGAGVALITPFKENGEVDYPRLQELIEFQIANQTDALIICGTTGESSTLTMEEHKEVLRFAAKVNNGRLPFIAGAGSNCTATAIELSLQAKEDGADGLLLVTPYYNKATQEGLKRHYAAIADAVKLPIILYNVPSRTGCNIAPETAAWMGKNIEHVVAIKEAGGDISAIAQMMSLAEGSLDLYSGNDDQIVPIMSLGGIGVISVLSNVAPKQTHDICQLYLEGKVKESAALQLQSIALVKSLFSEVNPIPVKKACELMGMCSGYLRSPLTEISKKNEEILIRDMKEYGLI